MSVTVCDQGPTTSRTAAGYSGTLTIPNATPWGPGKPYLYDFIVRLADDSGVQVDEYSAEDRRPLRVGHARRL